MGKGRSSPNDDRSRSMNPQDSVGQATIDNRANQLNPEHDAYHSSRGSGGDNDDYDFDEDSDTVSCLKCGREPIEGEIFNEGLCLSCSLTPSPKPVYEGTRTLTWSNKGKNEDTDDKEEEPEHPDDVPLGFYR